MAVGRISGPLLKANLVRQGVDLAFETNLLYLDVNNGRVGIKTASPTHDLTVNGTTRTTNIEATTQADLASFTITSNTIASSNSTINITPSGANPVVYQAKVVVDDVNITGSTISTTGTNTDLSFTTSGTGVVNVNSNMNVNGNLHATGTITADGNITLGDANTDNIVFAGEVNSNIVPDATNTYNLGSASQKWADVFAQTVTATTITTTGLTVNGVDLNLRQGNIIYVSKNGNDSSSGTHENDPFLTVKQALTVATSGTTIYVYPGTYTEVFPLTIPVGVVLKGSGLRSVTIQPTGGTITNDAILLNGETTVEDLTITGFRFNSGANTGYGFRFATNITVTTRSPYIRNVTVITRGSTTSGSDPYGFDANDAGKGALADGSVANASSKEAAMLFHSCTFFTPNQECISATNGTRIEWLNSFSYFADKGFALSSGSTGFAGVGQTRLHINSRIGTWSVGNTLSYYDTDGTTVLASGTIASVDSTNNYVNLTGKQIGFETITDRVGKTVYPQGNAKLSTAIKKFGTASLALDGVGDYVTLTNQADFGFGTSDFTIETWVYKNTVAYQSLFDFRSAAIEQAIFLGINTSNQLYLYVNGVITITTAATVSLSTWTHVALVRSNATTKIYINGTQSGASWADITNYSTTKPLRIGADWTASYGFTGYIDDVKVSKGVARYTSTFVAPTVPLTGDLNTVLLLHFNGTNNSTTFIDDGITYQDLRTSAGGTSNLINFADYSDFGVEVRSIGSACVYGNYGVVGDGDGVIAYLISSNLAYVGAGKKSTNDPTDRIQANEIVKTNRAKIYFTSVDNEGNFRVGDSFFVNQKTGEVLFNNQALTITAPDGVTFTDGANTTVITATSVTTGNIRVHDNNIDSTTGAVTVTAANGVINLQNNTYITGDLDVTGNVTIGGNITFGDQTTDTISFVAGINSSLVPATTGAYDLGTASLRWQNLYLSGAFNTLGNVTATGNLTSSGYLQLSDVRISGNTVQTTTTNTDLNLQANGTGNVVVEGIKVDANNIQSVATNSNITLTPQGTGGVIVNSNQSIRIPVGDTSQRPATPTNGMIRYNDQLGQYEGWNGTYWLKLSGVQDLDGNTKITAELTPGANDNTIRFYSAGNIMATIDSTKLYAVDFQTSQLDVTTNTISAINTNTDINLLTTGTGGIVIGNLKFKNNTISNVVPDAVTVFSQQGYGYTKITGTNGVVIPSGTTLNRPAVTETGMIRFNTESQITEIFNGAIWTSVAGTLTGVTFDDATNIGVEVALLFG
jgi:hypothetical protein